MKKILTAPYIDQTQQWVYGCESISAVMLLQYLGLEIDPDTFIDTCLPRGFSTGTGENMVAPDPMYYYINEPRDLTGWGCYAPCIVTALENALTAAGKADLYTVSDETGKTAAQLCKQYIDRGLPVVFWATLNFEPSETVSQWTLSDGRPFVWKDHEHCLLLVGYDDENFWFNDPWQNHGCCPCPRALAEKRHAEQGMYAVAIQPKE